MTRFCLCILPVVSGCNCLGVNLSVLLCVFHCGGVVSVLNFCFYLWLYHNTCVFNTFMPLVLLCSELLIEFLLVFSWFLLGGGVYLHVVYWVPDML